MPPVVEQSLHLDSAYLVAVHEQHSAWLRSLCGRLLGHRDALEVDDAVQQVFITLSNQPDRIQDERATVAWLRRTALHMCANISRSRKARQAREASQRPAAHDLASVTDHDLLADLESSIAELAPELREVIEHRYYEGLSANEIATALALKPATVRKRQQRALTHLRERMGKRGHAAVIILVAVMGAGPAHAAAVGAAGSASTATWSGQAVATTAAGSARGASTWLMALGVAASAAVMVWWLVVAMADADAVTNGLAEKPPAQPAMTDGSALVRAADPIRPAGALAVEPAGPHAVAHPADEQTAVWSDALAAQVEPHRRVCVLADVLIRFDQNRDGCLSTDERRAAEVVLGSERSVQVCEKTWALFDRLDADGNGALTQREYLKYYDSSSSAGGADRF